MTQLAVDHGEARSTALTVLVATLLLILGALPLHLLGGLWVLVRDDIAFDIQELGLAVSVYFGTSAVFSIPAGIVVNRLGPSRTLRGAAVATGLVLIAMGLLAVSWIQVLLLLAIGGVSAAMIQVGSNVMLAVSVPRRRQGLAFGVKMAAIPGASVLAGLALPLVALTAGWRPAFIGSAILAVLVMTFMPRVVVAVGQHRPDTSERDARLGSLLVVALGAGLGSGAGTSLTPFFVPYLVDSGHLPGAAGLALAMGSLTGMGARVFLGWIADRRGGGALQMAAMALTVGACGFGVLAVAPDGGALAVGLLLAFGGGFGWAGLLILAVARINPIAPARALATVQSATFGGAILGPAAFGQIAHATSFTVAWITMGIVLMTSATVLFHARRLIIRDRQRVIVPPSVTW